MVNESVTRHPWRLVKRVLPQHTDHGGVIDGVEVIIDFTDPLNGSDDLLDDADDDMDGLTNSEEIFMLDDLKLMDIDLEQLIN